MWDFCDSDSVPDNDTSGDKLIQSEKIAMTYRNFVVRCFYMLWQMELLPNSRLQDIIIPFIYEYWTCSL